MNDSFSQTPDETKPLSIEIYTDGGYFENLDVGGWGSVIFQQNKEIERLSDWQKQTSSLEMELKAAVSALDRLYNKIVPTHPPYQVTLYTDSRILIEGLTQKIHLWRQNRWVHKSGNPVKYRSLWEKLEELTYQYHVVWKWVKGHNGNKGNAIADGLAREAVINRLNNTL
ncbi:MAG: ribonuclease H family protein [Pseudomonadota bacterium]